MVVSMLRMVLKLGETSTIKDKRKIVLAIKDKLHHRYKLSCAEVDLLDSITFAEIGAALVSNSPQFGEKVLRDAVTLSKPITRLNSMKFKRIMKYIDEKEYTNEQILEHTFSFPYCHRLCFESYVMYRHTRIGQN